MWELRISRILAPIPSYFPCLKDLLCANVKKLGRGQKLPFPVIQAEPGSWSGTGAGIQSWHLFLDSRVRGSDNLLREHSMGKIVVTLFFIAALVVAAPCGCTREEASEKGEKITLALVPWPGSDALYVAYEKGYFRAQGLDPALQSYISEEPCLDAVLSGKADIATAGDAPIAQAVVMGKPVRVIDTLCEVDHAVIIVARKDRGISSAGDLAGKRIGVVKASTADFFLHILLTISYIPAGEVRVINLAPNEMVDALLSGEVDAVSTWYPYTTTAIDKLGDKAVILDAPDLYRMTWDFVTSEQFVEKSPERIKKVLAAIIKANEFIREQPGEARVICSKYSGTGKPISEGEWKNYHFTATLDESLILNLEDQARWMIKSWAGGKGMPNFMNFIYTDTLRAVQPEAVEITGK
jgi:NitT/TauT family transport system substrate-binding protein